MQKLISALTVGLLIPMMTHAQAVSCKRPDGGRYVWGQSPTGCDAQGLGDVKRAEKLYGKLIFDRRHADSKSQMVSYMSAMDATIKKIASDYIRRRNPKVSKAEVETFVRAIHSVATQESYWTHYRIAADGRLKLMTGDHNESLGMMQLHESAHSAKGRSRFDLARNILMGVEHFYMNWLQAGRASCVHTLSQKARAAYSAYNAGPASVCRWQNESAEWHRNDVGYYQKFERRPWRSYVKNAEPPVDLDCALAGGAECAHHEVADEKPVDLDKKIVQLKSGGQCFSVDGKTMYCAPDLRTFSCLDAYNPGLAKNPVVKIDDEHPSFKKYDVKKYQDRDTLCRAAISDIALPGELVRVKSPLSLLDKPDGKKIADADPTLAYQVVDYEASGTALTYRVATSKGLLWLHAGDAGARQVEKVSDTGAQPVERVLPVAGDQIKINHDGGINLRSEASTNGKILDELRDGTALTVTGVSATGGVGERWLQVKFKKDTGWIYSGQTSPEPDVNKWVKITGTAKIAAKPVAEKKVAAKPEIKTKAKTEVKAEPKANTKADSKVESKTTASSDHKAKVIWKGGMNFRSGPSTDDKVIGSIPENAEVVDLGAWQGPLTSEHWIRVRYDGKVGALYVGQTKSDWERRISE